ncbi:MAG: apolipoprotein N-acyltransferase [Alphaproteobacteria bacterium]|nr:apolipoprotein N-acyltransferase [Alphaproteobacteria bacterium]
MIGPAERIRSARGAVRYGLAFVAGALSALALAPFNAVPVLLLTFPVLVLLIDGAGPGGAGLRRAGFLGWFFGFGYFLALLHWLAYPFLVDADRFAWMMPLGVAVLPAGLALFTAAAFVAARASWTPGPQRVIVFAIALAGSEWLRGHMFTGFPWGLVGYAWTSVLPVAQAASVVGSYGLSFLTALAAASPAALASPPGSAWGVLRRPAAMPVLSFCLVAGIAVAGSLALLEARPVTGDLRLRIVQPNVPQDQKWVPSNQGWIWDRLVTLTAAPPGSEMRRTLVLWPESAVPFVLARSEPALAQVGRILGPDTILAAGSNRVEGKGAERHVYNSVHIVNGDGSILATYDKHRLVPFGEYLPFRPLLAAVGLRKLTEGIGFSEGRALQTLVVPGLPALGPLVCYEAIFPGAVADPVRRPGLLVNLTDDSWFGPYSGPRQHLAIARMRAIEEGLPLARAANTGISALIDSYGRVVQSLGLGEIGVIEADLPATAHRTLYSRIGDLGFLALLFLAGLLVRFSDRGHIL